MGVLVAHTLTLRMIGQVRFVSQRATLVGLGRGLWANESAGRLGLSEKVLNLASAPGLLFSPRWSSTHTRTKDEHTEERNNQRREEQMKIWRQLNDKDEAERTRIASLIAAVSKHTNHQSSHCQTLQKPLDSCWSVFSITNLLRPNYFLPLFTKWLLSCDKNPISLNLRM